ncbi:MAG: hypothetical protein AAGB34_02370, partial [Planctomycetota bacterium]
MIRSALLPVILILALGTMAGPFLPDAQAQDGLAIPDHQRFTPRMRRIVTDELTRGARLRLALTPDPTFDDLRTTALLIRLARRLTPDDLELLRLEREAWASAGEDSEVLAINRKILKLDPEDQITQLAVINARISEQQTAELRLATYRRIQERGGAIHPAVRSRLALDSALLARDFGDEIRYFDDVTLAATLDVTNKDAAVLFATEFLDRATEPRDRVEILCNVVLADPIDEAAMLNLAHELMSHGAFDGAARMFELHRRRLLQGEGGLELNGLVDAVLINWMSKGPESGLQALASMDAEARRADEERRRELELEGFDPGPRPAGYLVQRLEELELAIHVSRNDVARARQSIQAIIEAKDRLQKHLDELDESEGGLSQAKKDKEIFDSRLELVWARLFAGEQVPLAREELNTLIIEAEDRGEPLSESAIARFDAWFDVHAGKTAEARTVLEPLAKNDPLARWALAIAAERDGLRDEAARHFAYLALENPATAIGATARGRISLLLGQPIGDTEVAQELNQYIESFAPWLESVVAQTSSFTSMKTDYVEQNVDILEPALLRITIRNKLDFPFAVGSQGTFSKAFADKVLVTHRAEHSAESFKGLIRPEIINFDRHLRLDPKSEVVVDVNLRRGLIGEAFTRYPEGRATVRSRAVLHFEFDANGQEVTSPRRSRGGSRAVLAPRAISSQTDRLLIRYGFPTAADSDVVANELSNSAGSRMTELVLLAVARVGEITNSEDAARKQEADQLRAAIIERLPTLGELEQAFVLQRLNSYGLLSELLEEQTPEELGLVVDSPYVGAVLMLS